MCEAGSVSSASPRFLFLSGTSPQFDVGFARNARSVLGAHCRPFYALSLTPNLNRNRPHPPIFTLLPVQPHRALLLSSTSASPATPVPFWAPILAHFPRSPLPFPLYNLNKPAPTRSLPSGTSPQFDVGFARNARSVLGADPRFWLLPVYAEGPVGDGVHWPVHMRGNIGVASDSSSFDTEGGDVANGVELGRAGSAEARLLQAEAVKESYSSEEE
jgi:hypothetical protein